MPSPASPPPPVTLSLGRWQAVNPPTGYSYLVSQPPASANSSSGRRPLILFLHGAAERGRDVTGVLRLGLPRLLAGGAVLSPAEQAITEQLTRDFILIAPQCPAQEVWDDQALLSLLDQAQRDLPIDAARTYLTGLSMGGFGVWTLGLRHPARFAAIVPICGGGRIRDLAEAMERQPAAVRSLGIWAFHGARDRIVPLEESQRMIDALHEADLSEARLTVYPEGEHDAWSPAYANPELSTWLLRHRRGD